MLERALVDNFISDFVKILISVIRDEKQLQFLFQRIFFLALPSDLFLPTRRPFVLERLRVHVPGNHLLLTELTQNDPFLFSVQTFLHELVICIVIISQNLEPLVKLRQALLHRAIPLLLIFFFQEAMQD